MSFERRFQLAAHGLSFVGVAALAATREVEVLYVALALAALLWSAWKGWGGEETNLDARLANLLTLLALASTLLPVVFRGASPVSAIANFLLVLCALKALVAKSHRDWMQILGLSFFQLVASAALTVEPVFAIVFLAYLLLAPWALVLLLLRREIGRVGAPERLAVEAFVDPSLFRSVVAVTLVLFVSTLVVFLLFPRVGSGFFAHSLGTGAALTGFSDQVGLGDVTALKKDSSVALRVTVDRPEVLMSVPRYWRGAALDTFDGRRWTRAAQTFRSMVRPEPGLFLAPTERTPRTLLHEEVILEPMESPALFVLGHPLQVRGGFPGLLIDGLGNLRMPAVEGMRIRYEILASIGPREEGPTAQSRTLPGVNPRIAELALEKTSGLVSEDAKAEALLSVFRHGFVYTMTPGAPGAGDPLAHFLFDSKRGHCEYFASTLAVMLRAVGIPSLVVNGYLGGEWNPYGGYFLLRQSDAHSWVEAYVDGEWRTLDPTPAAAVSGSRNASTSLVALLDSYRMRWYRYVINYNGSDQVEIALSLSASSRRFWRSLSIEAWRAGLRRWVARGFVWPVSILALAGLAAIGLSLRRWTRSRRAAAPLFWASACYFEMLRRLERRGLSKRPAETPEEFTRKIAPALDKEIRTVERITALYQEARFSSRTEGEAGTRAEIAALLERLEPHP